jgi:hypothetical protein
LASKKIVETGPLTAQLPRSKVDLAALYEALRAQALGEGRLAKTSLDLGLFLCEGMASWMAAQSSPETMSVSRTTRYREAEPEGSRDALRTEVAMILASMAAPTDREVK